MTRFIKGRMPSGAAPGAATRVVLAILVWSLGGSSTPGQELSDRNSPATAEPGKPALEYEVLKRGPLHEAYAEVHTADPGLGILVPNTPPPDIVEIAPDSSPEAGARWTRGYWMWGDEREGFVWVSGAWRKPPPDRTWVAGSWSRVAGGHRWASGYWSEPGHTVGALPRPPASLEQGPVGNQPSARHFWIPGCWLRQVGQYRWRSGYWHEFQPEWVWAPDRYVWSPTGYIFLRGYWDYRFLKRGRVFAPVRFRGPVWRDPNYRYRPTCVLSDRAIALHRFVRPTHRHYYIGDYYGSVHERRNIVPSFQFHRSRLGYDPLCEYNRVHFGLRGIDYDYRMRSWHGRMSASVGLRSPHALLEQSRYARSHGGGSHRSSHSLLGVKVNPAAVESRLRGIEQRERDRWEANRALTEFRARRRIESERH